MWIIKQIFEVTYTIPHDIFSWPVMSMHISCASKCSQYNYYYTVGVIINMLQKSKEKKPLNFHLLHFARTIWQSILLGIFPKADLVLWEDSSHSRRYFPYQNTSILFIDIQTERLKYLILISLITCLDRKLTAYLEFCRLD